MFLGPFRSTHHRRIFFTTYCDSKSTAAGTIIAFPRKIVKIFRVMYDKYTWMMAWDYAVASSGGVSTMNITKGTREELMNYIQESRMLIDTLASVNVLCFSKCENRVIIVVNMLLIDVRIIEQEKDSPYSRKMFI